MLVPFQDLEVKKMSNEDTNFTDHDVLEYVPENDLKTNATVIAAIVYQLVARPTKFPRKGED